MPGRGRRGRVAPAPPPAAGVWRVGAAVSQFAFGTDSARDSAGRVAVLPAASRPLAADAAEARPRADKFTLISGDDYHPAAHSYRPARRYRLLRRP
ncbi:hypothetical protein CBM2589_A90865 [Cupriavidus taiwanensis]|uniref:Uncharacterized protein n=1 Tax=Cupriavidus taiwanensis TaxID=164546 RepID=A0A976A9S6_9BURK|nr:hypothetical protein CBM2589_A90865 [Cupriavidus taiwanensis]